MLPEVHRLTPADQHFIHGYYVLQPWDDDEQLFPRQQLPFGDRLPQSSDAVTVGVIGRDDGSSLRRVGRVGSLAWRSGLNSTHRPRCLGVLDEGGTEFDWLRSCLA